MLRELLLALSGNASPLFSKEDSAISSHLSSSEAALLKQLAHLGHLHQETRTQANQVSKSHHSIICRATATSIIIAHLAAFQRKILDVEQGILSKDQTFVGAYDIVPLSGIATAFAGWDRRLAWLHRASEEMYSGQSGPGIIDWLRKESRTGFPDIEAIALDLVRVAEVAWLRQLSAWLFYGHLQTHSTKDFFVQADQLGKEFRIEPGLFPPFVHNSTAASILFIGRSLNYIKNLQKGSYVSGAANEIVLAEHMKNLSAAPHPIHSTTLARIITDVRSSLARNVLQELLPTSETVKLLKVLQEFFLLARGEFSVALVAAADQCLRARETKRGAIIDAKLGGALIRDIEMNAVLSKTWSSLAALQDINDETIDEVLELARDTLNLESPKSGSKKEDDRMCRVSSLFNDVLLVTPTSLSITISSPLNLFFTPEDAKAYSLINSYLLSIRRAHMHITGLWKLSNLRRNRSIPDNSNIRQTVSKARRINMRPIWAAVSSASSFMSELGEYFQGEVIAESWAVFECWLHKSNEEHDPEILAVAHRVFLANIVKLLILDNDDFVINLRNLISQCDRVVSLAQRYDDLQQTLRAFAGSTGQLKDLPLHLAEDQNRLAQDMGFASKNVNQLLKCLAGLLNDIDASGLDLVAGELRLDESTPDAVTSFVPWRGVGIRSLLMRLDFRIMLDD